MQRQPIKAKQTLSRQVQHKFENKKIKKKKIYDGNMNTIISTGSTLLDLAISGGRIKGGGIPAGIFVEVFGPNSAGKTVLLCEMAGGIQRQNGSVMFHDPEGRLNKQFAKQFDFKTESIEYGTPDRVPEVFKAVREWEPESLKSVNGIFADSLAALSTDIEMDNDDGDKMGMRRAKEFSEQLRKTCRIISNNNYLMVASNQIRESTEQYGGPQAPGGKAIGFYASLRLKASSPSKIWKKKRIQGKDTKRVVGVKTTFEVFKSSVWKPYHTADVYIIFDYGIDDIRANLQFIKDYSSHSVYSIGDKKLDKSIEESITIIEEEDLIDELKEEVIDLWHTVEENFEQQRKPKRR